MRTRASRDATAERSRPAGMAARWTDYLVAVAGVAGGTDAAACTGAAGFAGGTGAAAFTGAAGFAGGTGAAAFTGAAGFAGTAATAG
jgi:hypothetical protein